MIYHVVDIETGFYYRSHSTREEADEHVRFLETIGLRAEVVTDSGR
jgi:hypothetical protein